MRGRMENDKEYRLIELERVNELSTFFRCSPKDFSSDFTDH